MNEKQIPRLYFPILGSIVPYHTVPTSSTLSPEKEASTPWRGLSQYCDIRKGSFCFVVILSGALRWAAGMVEVFSPSHLPSLFARGHSI